MNNIYVEKLVRLIKAGLIAVADIKDAVYRAEVESRLGTQ